MKNKIKNRILIIILMLCFVVLCCDSDSLFIFFITKIIAISVAGIILLATYYNYNLKK